MKKEKIMRMARCYITQYGLLAVGIVVTIFITGSLWTFREEDLSFFYCATNGTVHNMFGFLGANVSAFLFYFFGKSSILLIPLIGYWWSFFSGFSSLKKDNDRLVGTGIFFITSMLLCNIYKVGLLTFGYNGGLFGYYLSYGLLRYFDETTQYLLLYVLLTISTVLMLRFSHLIVARYILQFSQKSWSYVMHTNHIPAKSIRYVGYLLAQLFVQCGVFLKWCKKVLTGAVISESDMSVTAFERDESLDDSVDALLQDLFIEERNNDSETLGSEVLENDSFEEIDFNQEEILFDDVLQEEEKDSDQDVVDEVKKYSLPDVDVMFAHEEKKKQTSSEVETLEEQSAILEEKLRQFGIQGSVVRVHPGPVITLYEYKPENNIKLSKIVGLGDDLSMALQALSIRILAPIPGKDVVGFEVANKVRQAVFLSDMLRGKEWTDVERFLPMILGEDTSGKHVVVDLAGMPHLLIAGSTGSGKSVALNSMLASLLCGKKPDEVQLIIIDPKRLEFAAYEHIAHLLFPIVTDVKKVVPILKWVVQTMEERYELMSEHGVKNIFDYQKRVEKQIDLEPMPFIVVIIDELADLMMTTGKDVEDLIARIAQMSRAAGIHMIVATQRPSVDVITGLIKVNFPNRISFKVMSKVDSRTILDEGGAEQLLGKGDMLFIDSKNPQIQRVHGAYISDREIAMLVKYIQQQQPVNYQDVTNFLTTDSESGLLESDEKLYQEVIEMLQDCDEVSISMVQRRFRIGYNRSARIIEALEHQGLILSSDGGKMRRVVKN